MRCQRTPNLRFYAVFRFIGNKFVIPALHLYNKSRKLQLFGRLSNGRPFFLVFRGKKKN
jgi:hypothetical protein